MSIEDVKDVPALAQEVLQGRILQNQQCHFFFHSSLAIPVSAHVVFLSLCCQTSTEGKHSELSHFWGTALLALTHGKPQKYVNCQSLEEGRDNPDVYSCRAAQRGRVLAWQRWHIWRNPNFVSVPNLLPPCAAQAAFPHHPSQHWWPFLQKSKICCSSLSDLVPARPKEIQQLLHQRQHL